MGTPQILRAHIADDVVFGEGVTVVEPVNLYGCTIGDGCFIGPFVEIQKGATIGRQTRVQSHAFICDLVSIGEDCFISHGVMFINDTFSTGDRARGNTSLYRPTIIGNHVAIGTGTTVLPVTICDRAVIGAGSVVTHDILEPGIYAGCPARLIRAIQPSEEGS